MESISQVLARLLSRAGLPVPVAAEPGALDAPLPPAVDRAAHEQERAA